MNAVVDPARRRAALAIGLGSILSGLQQAAALRLWDESYAVQRPAALQEYISELSQLLDLGVRERHDLRMALYQSLMRHDAQAPRASAAATPAATAMPPPSVPPVPPAPGPTLAPEPALRSGAVSPAAFVVFNRMADAMLAGVRQGGASAVTEFTAGLDRHTTAAGLRADHAVILLRWGRGIGPLDALASTRERDFANLFHCVYVAAAEAVGPVAADRLLARASQAAEALPEADQFPPTRLL